MSTGRNAGEVAEAVATDAEVLLVAARELHESPEYLSVTRLAGDASTRAYFRVTRPEGSVVAARYPRSFNIGEGALDRFDRWCADNPADGRVTFSNDPLCYVETASLFERAGVPVPEIVAIADREGIIFQEDIGDAILQHWVDAAPADAIVETYDRAVDLLGRIRSTTETARQSSLVAGVLSFDAAKFAWELDLFRTATFDEYLGGPLSESELEAFRLDSHALATELAALPSAVCHRDYHARNLHVRRGYDDADGLVVIDFQDARLGPLTYDIVSLVEDPYAVLDDHLKQRLVDRFVDGLTRDGLYPGDDAFRAQYDLMTVQRLLKAIGTYTHMASTRGKREYIPYIEPSARTVRGALDRLGRFAALASAVEAILQHGNLPL